MSNSANYVEAALIVAIRTVLEGHQGPGNAITMSQLHAAATQVATGEAALLIPMRRYDQTRRIRAAVAALRQGGAPIGSGSNGYFWAVEPKQLTPTIARFRARSLAALAQEAALRRTAMACVAAELFNEFSTTPTAEPGPQQENTHAR